MTYTIAQPEAHDVRDEMLGLWSRNLPGASPRRYDWLYENGPATEWVVRSEDEQVVGAIGMMRRTMKLFSASCQVGQPIDLNVDLRHRLGGPAIRLQRRLTETVDAGEIALTYGLPNAQAEPVLRRAGYRELGAMGRWTKPLRSENLLGRWIENRPLRRGSAAAVDMAIRLASRETYGRRRRGVHAEIVDRFDERFDRLWQTASAKYAIVGNRGSAYLNWRFADCPDARYRTLCLFDDCDRLLAYLTYSQPQDTAYVGDLFFAERRDLNLLLAEFLWDLRRRSAEAATIVFFGDATVQKTLRSFGFQRRPCEWKVMIYANEAALADAFDSTDCEAAMQATLCANNWYLTRADIDSEN